MEQELQVHQQAVSSLPRCGHRSITRPSRSLEGELRRTRSACSHRCLHAADHGSCEARATQVPYRSVAACPIGGYLGDIVPLASHRCNLESVLLFCPYLCLNRPSIDAICDGYQSPAQTYEILKFCASCTIAHNPLNTVMYCSNLHTV